MPARRTTLLALAAAVALPLAACSGDGDAEPSPTPSGEGDATPLETLVRDYLAEWSAEDVNRRLAQMEESIAACMAEQGFDYTPVDWSPTEVDLSAGLDMQVGTLEFAEQFGYGITTDPFASGLEDVVDPNEAYVAAMSDAERDAYFAALYGETWADADAAGGDGAAGGDDAEPAGEPLDDWEWERAGCSGRAQHEVLTAGIEDESFTALQEDMEQLFEDVAGDPRLAQANRDWAACMLDAGFDGLAAVGDGEATIAAEVAAAEAAVLGRAPSAAPDVDPRLAARAALGPARGEATEAALAEARAAITPREIDMAVADARCRASTGYDEVRRRVDTEYQLAFLAAHREEIQAWLESLTEGRTGG